MRVRDAIFASVVYNKESVPNADFMLLSQQPSAPLSPVKGERGGQDCNGAHLLHARLSSSVEEVVS